MAMGTSVIELGEGLSLVPCTVVSLSFVRADVSVKPVDEWQLKSGLMTLFKKRFGVTVADRDLVVQKEKNYFKKRRDEPIADGTLHLWGASSEVESAAKGLHEGGDFGKYVAENVNGVELSIGGLKLKCLAVIKATNDFDALKRGWEAPRRGAAPQGQGGPTTLTLKGVPSRWFAEPRVSSKPSVLVTHTIFSSFGEIRNLEVLSNEEPGSNLKSIGDMAAALQCQIWVQFDNHSNFCNALHAFCGRAMQKAGSNFRAMYVADWDREDYFSVLNVRKRKFEKERLERQLQAEAERVKKQEMEARHAELARAEAERLKMELMAAALREEEERQQQLAEQAKKLEEESRKQAETSSEEEGLIQDERQESSDDEMPESERETKGRTLEDDDRFSPPQRVNGRFISEREGERQLQQGRGKRGHSSEDEDEVEALHPSRAREKRRHPEDSDFDSKAPSPYLRDKRRFTVEDRRETVPMKERVKKRGTSEEDEEVRHVKKRKDTSESDSETESELEDLSHARKKRRGNSESEPERDSPEVGGKRDYTSEEKRRYTSDEEERLSPDLAEKKKVDTHKDGGQNLHAPEESADQKMYNPLERWQPEEETVYYSKLSTENILHGERISGPVKDRRMPSRKLSPSPLTTDKEEGDSEEDEYVNNRESGRRNESDDSNQTERWALDMTHSAASLSALERLLQAGRHTLKRGGLADLGRPERRPRSVIIISR